MPEELPNFICSHVPLGNMSFLGNQKEARIYQKRVVYIRGG
jgi:hypothetical protein